LSRPFASGEAVLAVAIWLSTGFEPPFVFHPAMVTPLIVAAFMLRVLMVAPRPSAA
jgi:hypothetical protein